MNRILTMLLTLVEVFSLRAQGFVNLPSIESESVGSFATTYSTQISLGYVLPGSEVSVKVEYPEFEVLTSKQVKALKKAGISAVAGEIVPTVLLGKERGTTVADVTIPTLFRREGKWCRLTSFKLRPVTSDEQVSTVYKLASKALQRATTSSRYASSSVLSSGTWVKIRVSEEGVYELTDATLSKWGFSDPENVKLYGYGGRLLPEEFTFEGNDALIDDLCEVPLYRRSGNSLFFAEGTVRWDSDGTHHKNTFSDYSYYFLTEGDSPAEFSTLESPSSSGTSVSTVTAHALVDEDAYCWYEGGRIFFDDETFSDSKTVKLSLPGLVSAIDSEGETIEDNVQTIGWDVGCSNSSSSTTVTLRLGSGGDVLARGTITSASADGESARAYRGTFTTDALTDNSVTFALTSSDASARLDYIRVNYVQQLSASNPVASFSPNVEGAVTFSVADASSSTRVWQLGTASSELAELPYSLSGTTLTAQASDGTCRFTIVDVDATYDAPEYVGAVENQDLHADRGIQYVMVIPESGKLESQAERLAEAHRSQSGLEVKVVRADQLFNEFSSGTPDASAIRRYMKMLYDCATTDDELPKYLLLFGDCAWDFRGVTSDWSSIDSEDFLPAYELSDQESYNNTSYSIGTLHSYVTDDYYGLLDDGEGSTITNEKIDLGIGRLPCHDEATATILVDHTLEYLTNARTGVWKNNMFALADVGDENLHMIDADTVCNQVKRSAGEEFMLRRLYLDSYSYTQTAKGITYPQATEKLKQYMQQGALIFNYNGHGSPDRLSHNYLIEKEDMSENVSDALPLWIYASCEITPYDQQIEDLGRNALYNEDGGAVAVVCAARSVYSNYNRYLNKGMVKYLFMEEDGERLTFGESLRRTKCELISGSSSSTIGSDYTMNKLKYALLGDPALQLSYPVSGIVIDSINGEPLTSESFLTIPTGSLATFSGFVNEDTSAGEADTSFSGTLTATLFNPLETITCEGYGNTSADPEVYEDYTRVLFQGNFTVSNGRFTVSLIIPQSVSFSKDAARLSLYAVNSDGTLEFNGCNEQFCLYGSVTSENPDTLGPTVYIYLDTPDFPDGGVVGPDAVFYATVSDSTSISMAGGSLGHDIELILDDDASDVIVLNDYFAFDNDSYNSGSVEYNLTDMSLGRHSLAFRVWDSFDNSTTQTLNFLVREEGASEFEIIATDVVPSTSTRFITSFIRSVEGDVSVRTEVYSVVGMRVWSNTQTVSSGEYASVDWDLCDYGGRKLPPGIYLFRSVVDGKETKTKKMVIR